MSPCFQLFNYFMAIGSAVLVDRIGRRTLFLISNCGMLVGEYAGSRFRRTCANKVVLATAFGLWTMLGALREETQSKIAGQATVGIIVCHNQDPRSTDLIQLRSIVVPLLRLLRHRVLASARRVYGRDLAIHNPCQGLRCHGMLHISHKPSITKFLSTFTELHC